MEWLRGWVTGIASAAFLLAIAQAVTPPGTGKKVVRLAGGLVMVLVVIRPLLGVSLSDFSLRDIPAIATMDRSFENVENAGMSAMQTIIEERTAAYILTEVQTRNLSLTVTVSAKALSEGEVPMPYAVTLRGAEVSKAEQESLARWLETQVGLPRERQTWIFG